MRHARRIIHVYTTLLISPLNPLWSSNSSHGISGLLDKVEIFYKLARITYFCFLFSFEYLNTVLMYCIPYLALLAVSNPCEDHSQITWLFVCFNYCMFYIWTSAAANVFLGRLNITFLDFVHFLCHNIITQKKVLYCQFSPPSHSLRGQLDIIEWNFQLTFCKSLLGSCPWKKSKKRIKRKKADCCFDFHLKHFFYYISLK